LGSKVEATTVRVGSWRRMIAEGTPRKKGSKRRPIPAENARIRNLPDPKPLTAPERKR
jgi:hypothetical protein